MQFLLMDDGLRERIHANGRALVEGEYAIERVVEKIEGVYSVMTRKNYKKF
ncbi:glycosyltransferase [Methanocalculus chunghsingensis]|uniref:glycosyltransferase n=1 Tax=Methanocalculus chunghsingensis TaxID=156457 RepID=UPI001B8D9E81|nr:hypothetical protein [Methanocalculus chunghsingensis]